jgi:hypothetical protein
MYVNGRMIPVEIIPGKGGEEAKREWSSEWMPVWYIWYIVITFVNSTIYAHVHPAEQ